MPQTEPSIHQIRALERALGNRKGFRQLLDELTFADDRDTIPDDEEFTPLQLEVLTEAASAVLNASE